MALSEFERKMIDELFSTYCENKVPPHLRHQIKIEFRIRENEVILVESRPHWQGRGEWLSMNVARFTKDGEAAAWNLYWADRNSIWRKYSPLPSHRSIEKLLQEVEKNETGAFWG